MLSLIARQYPDICDAVKAHSRPAEGTRVLRFDRAVCLRADLHQRVALRQPMPGATYRAKHHPDNHHRVRAIT